MPVQRQFPMGFKAVVVDFEAACPHIRYIGTVDAIGDYIQIVSQASPVL